MSRIIAPGPQAERMAILLEESGEVVQAIGKIQRHGWNATRRSLGAIHVYDNRKQLEEEIGNLYAIIDRMVNAGDIDRDHINAAAMEHNEKLKGYTYFQPDSRRSDNNAFWPATGSKGPGFQDMGGEWVFVGDRVRHNDEKYIVIEVLQDGDAYIQKGLEDPVCVKWNQMVKWS